MVNFIQNYWLTITMFLLAVIAAASLLPGSSLPSVSGNDKTHHAIAYAALMFPTALKKPKHWLVIAFALLCFSGAIELIQPYVNRHADWLDLLANGGGILCGIILAKVIRFFSVNPVCSLQ
jgi:VanZ family protein